MTKPTLQIAVVLTAAMLTGLGEEIWLTFFPKYIDALTASIWLVGAYGSIRLFVEGLLYAAGGRLAQTLGVRASMAMTALGPLAGYAIFLATHHPWAGIAGAILISSWDPLATSATFTVVAMAKNRAMAFAIQSILKRLPKIIGPAVGGFIVMHLGEVRGVRTAVAAGLAMTAASLLLQWRFLTAGAPGALRGFFRSVRELHPFLKRLLLADILTRWCDWMVRDYVVLYCMNRLGVDARLFGILVAVQMMTALLTYLPIGAISGGRQRAFIGVTLVFFAAFPVVLHYAHGVAALVAAFVVYGLREIGEPARKSMITSLMPDEFRAEGVGAYWAARSFAIFFAPLVGAWIWMAWGPPVLLLVAGACGVLAAIFYAAFQRRFAV